MSHIKYARMARRVALCLRDRGWRLEDGLLRVCPRCDNELAKDSKYCSRCGYIVPFDPGGSTLGDLTIAMQYALEDEL